MMKKQQGQSLLEVVIATALLILALTVMVAAVSTANANNRRAKERAIATRLAQSGQDWLRGLRDEQGWNNFGPLANGIYCLNNLTVASPITGSCGVDTFESSKTAYKREMLVSNTSPDEFTYKISVYWYSGRTNEEEVFIEGKLTEWQ
jgi:type II secretory pathway pseudopilin PulG